MHRQTTLSHGVTVTLQILVLSFQVRILVAQREGSKFASLFSFCESSCIVRLAKNRAPSAAASSAGPFAARPRPAFANPAPPLHAERIFPRSGLFSGPPPQRRPSSNGTKPHVRFRRIIRCFRGRNVGPRLAARAIESPPPFDTPEMKTRSRPTLRSSGRTRRRPRSKNLPERSNDRVKSRCDRSKNLAEPAGRFERRTGGFGSSAARPLSKFFAAERNHTRIGTRSKRACASAIVVRRPKAGSLLSASPGGTAHPAEKERSPPGRPQRTVRKQTVHHVGRTHFAEIRCKQSSGGIGRTGNERNERPARRRGCAPQRTEKTAPRKAAPRNRREQVRNPCGRRPHAAARTTPQADTDTGSPPRPRFAHPAADCPKTAPGGHRTIAAHPRNASSPRWRQAFVLRSGRGERHTDQPTERRIRNQAHRTHGGDPESAIR